VYVQSLLVCCTSALGLYSIIRATPSVSLSPGSFLRSCFLTSSLSSLHGIDTNASSSFKSWFLTYGFYYLIIVLIFTLFVCLVSWFFCEFTCTFLSYKIFIWNFHILTPTGKICHSDFMYLDLNFFCCLEIGTSSVDWAQQSRFQPEDRDRPQSPQCCFKNIQR
jgi:hypothetical protein